MPGVKEGVRKRGSECGNTRATKELETVCVTVDVLAMILVYYSFARYYHW